MIVTENYMIQKNNDGASDDGKDCNQDNNSGWLVGFLWHKIQKGHIVPDKLKLEQ